VTRILVVYPDNGFLRPIAERFPEVAFAFHEDVDAALEDAAGAAALISLGRIVARARADRFAAVPGMRWIQLCSAGADRLEGMAAPPHLVVPRAGVMLDGFVADQVMALLLALGRRLPDAVRTQAEGRWITASGRFESLKGRRATVLGFGDIGRAMARRLLGFGADARRRDAASDRAACTAFGDGGPGDGAAGRVGDGEYVWPRGTRRPAAGDAAGEHRPRRLARPRGAGGGAAERHLVGAGLDVTAPEPLPPRASAVVMPEPAGHAACRRAGRAAAAESAGAARRQHPPLPGRRGVALPRGLTLLRQHFAQQGQAASS
jgi:lactate dehydrogenase-like 2-hydroxyacid dehydrogenase